MPTLYLRDVPPALLKKLRARADAERRSVAQEAVSLIERALQLEPLTRPELTILVDRLRAKHERMRREGRKFPPAEVLVRQDRDR